MRLGSVFCKYALLIVLCGVLTRGTVNVQFRELDEDQPDDGEASASESASKEPLQVDKDSFAHLVKLADVGTLIMYYAAWCGHCKRMTHTWAKLAAKHNGNNNRFIVAQVDCTDQTELCSDNDVLAYPTFHFYKKNSVEGIFYDGERDFESFEEFLYSQMTNMDQVGENGETETKKAVYELEAKNFNSFISKGSHFIKFYAPWCGHCQRLAPIWDELGNVYINSKVKISKIDCTKHGEICSSYQIRGYPTLIFFQDGKLVKHYDRQRNIQEFSDFLNELVQFESDDSTSQTQHQTDDDEANVAGEVLDLNDLNFASAISKNGFIFVKFYAPWCSHCIAMAQTWKDLANRYKENEKIRIAEVDCTNNVQLCMNQNIEGYPTLILFKDGYRVVDYLGDRSLLNFVDFLNSHLEREDL